MRTPVEPVFVDRKTAAAKLMISVYTFDTWLRAGFIPQPQIERGQIIRWHWPSLEQHLLAGQPAAVETDPFIEAIRRHRARPRQSKGF